MLLKEKFKKHLLQICCIPLKCTSTREFARFVCGDCACIIYKRKGEDYLYTNDITKQIHESFLHHKKFYPLMLTKRRANTNTLKEAIIERDGLRCFYSGILMIKKEATIEHLIPLCRGGTYNIENLFLCTGYQNRKVGFMSASDKLKYKQELLIKNRYRNERRRTFKELLHTWKAFIRL